MPPEEYHAHPALSSSGARRLLPPSCPALFRHWQHREQHSAAFDLGKAAHLYVLTEGEAVELVDAPDWRTKAAREERERIRADGHVPVLPKELEVVQDMAGAIRAVPLARALLDPSKGEPEVSLFWSAVDDVAQFEVPCRARIDWLLAPTTGRVTAVDYKTTPDASTRGIERAVDNYGYHVQDAWYSEGLEATGLAAADMAFLFVFQEKTPPYLCHVVNLPPAWKALGHSKAQEARRTYADCMVADHWPGYSDDITELTIPRWVEARAFEEETA
jgi:hypothetical protein